MLKVSTQDTQEICVRIIDLMEDLSRAYSDQEEEGDTRDEDDGPRLTDAELLQVAIEEGTERGLPEEDVERIFRLMITMAKKSKED